MNLEEQLRALGGFEYIPKDKHGFLTPVAPRFTDPLLDLPFPEITPLSHYLSGEAAFNALVQSVKELAETAPKDHDVLIEAYGRRVVEVSFREPHTLIFRGFDADGHDGFSIVHYSRLMIGVGYFPKRGTKRVITGFRKAAEDDKPSPATQ
jgi:hypothetical protein